MRVTPLTMTLCLLLSRFAYSQCEPATVTITDYCNNQYAEFSITDPDPATRYQWFSDAAGNNSLAYGPNGDGKYFYSPTTYAANSGPQSFWYQKQTSGVTGGPQSAGFTGSTSGNGGGQTNIITVDADFDFTLNSITVPFHSWGAPAAGSYGVKIDMGGTPSNWHYFTPADLVAGPNNVYFLTIPIDVNGLGQGIPVTQGNNISIQGFAQSDGLEAAGTSFLEFAVLNAGINNTYTIGNPGSQLTIHQDANDRTTWPAGRYGFFDWDITRKCPLQQVTANEETDLSKCCTSVTTQPTITTNTGSKIYETPVIGTLTATNSNPAHYFKWYLEGVVVQEGVGLSTINMSSLGKYTVTVAEQQVDIDKISCGISAPLIKIREKKLFVTPTDTQRICLGDVVNMTSTGGVSDWAWSTNGGGNVASPITANTSWTPNAEGTFTATIEAMVPEGELVTNGDFEAGATGFNFSSRMREAPFGSAANANVPGCGNGPQLVFRNYGVIGGTGNGVFTVGNTPPLQDVWCFTNPLVDHTSGTGNYMMMDGLTSAGWQDLAYADNHIWEQTVVVEPNNTYTFSTWIAALDLGAANAPNIRLFVNGTELTLNDPLNYNANWDEVSGDWNSGNIQGPVTLTIFNSTNSDGGNDFAMDDVSFSSGNALQEDSVIVVVEECVDPCVPPTSVTINDDTTRVCHGANYTHTALNVLPNNPQDAYYYSWFKDGTQILAPTTTTTLTNTGSANIASSNGWYKIRVEDGNNDNDQCYLEDSIYLDVQALPNPILPNDTTLCFGDSIILDAGAGPGPGTSTYAWTPNNETTRTIVAKATGNYAVTVTSQYNCVGTDNITVTINPEVTVDLGDNDTLCTDGTATKNLDAGNGHTTYKWLPTNENTQSISVNSTNDYIAIVSDNIGCSDTDTVHIEFYDQPTVNLGNDTVVCKGPVVLDAGASVAGQTYLWTPTNETTQTISVNTNGVNTYKVVVSNWNCKDSDEVQVTIDSVLQVNIGPDTTVCIYDLPVTLDAGAGYAVYEWRDNVDAVLGATQTYNALAAGEYRVELEDATGCKGYDTINVLTNPRPDATINNGTDTITICPTSPNVNLTAEETGASYLWSPNNETTQSISTNIQNWYSVVVTLNGCTDEDSIYLEVANELKVNIGNDLTLCPGVEAEFTTAFKGFTHDWNNGAGALDTFKTTTAGQITVLVTDPGGCMGRDTANLTVENPLSISIGPNQTICIDKDSVDFAMVSGRTDVTVVDWNTGSKDFAIKSKTAGIHWLEVDSAGCVFRDSALLTINALPVVTLRPDTFICTGTGETIPLDAGNGFTDYLWSKAGSGNTQNIIATDSGEYKIQVTDNNGCVNYDSLYIDQKDATLFQLVNGKEDTTICPLGSALIDLPANVLAANNATWTWTMDANTSNGNSVTVDNRLDGDKVGINLTLRNEFGCISEDTFTVIVSNTLPILLRDTSLCVGDKITFDSNYPTNGYSFVWNDDVNLTNNTFSINNLALANTGTVKVEVVSDEGCSGDTTVNLTVNALPLPVLRDTAICEGQSVNFNPNVANAAAYYWKPTNETSATVTGNTTTNYKVIVTDVNGCIDSTTATLTVNALPVVAITQMPDEACIGEDIVLSTGMSNAFTFAWDPGNETTSAITVQTDNTYKVVVTETATGCENEAEKIVVFKPIPVAIITPDVDTTHICSYDKAALTGNTTIYDLSWEMLEESTPYSTQSISTSTEGTYVLTIDNDGCSATDTIYVDVHEIPEAPLGNDTVLCLIDVRSLTLSAGDKASKFQWSTGDTTSSINVTAQGDYSVDLTNEWGCTLTDEIFVDDDCPEAVFLPNAFTPNGDGLNDNFIIKGHNLLSLEVMVFNRWGEHIWTGNAVGQFWDGKYMGNMVNIDVYVWKMKWSYEDDDEKIVNQQRVGTVSVIR